MKLEDQVCTLEQSKRLAELLGKDAPESMLCWNLNDDKIRYRLYERHRNEIPAYTVAELGEMLITIGHQFAVEFRMWGEKFTADGCGLDASFDTEAQLRAALLINILENKQ